MASGHSIPAWDDKTWALLDDALRRFEDAWKAGPEPLLADFVPVPCHDPRYAWILVRLITVDRELRDQHGRPKSIEQYLSEFPSLREVPEAVAALRQSEAARSRDHLSNTSADGPSHLLEGTESLPSPAPKQRRISFIAKFFQRFSRRILGHGDTRSVDRHVGGIGPGGQRSQTEDTGRYSIGTMVGGIFQIRGVLGRGGMGIVYLAYDETTQRNVAIKAPMGKFVDDEEACKRFRREAESLISLTHPHIVHAFYSTYLMQRVGVDFGGDKRFPRAAESLISLTHPHIVHTHVVDDWTAHDWPAIFMEYCNGGSLAQRLRQGPLPISQALDIAIQVAWAMEFAHEKGLIHRDLKPGNVLLTSEGKAFVSDFGLVRRIDVKDAAIPGKGPRPEDKRFYQSLTQGLVVGTPAYMPPEQWEGRAYPQSDIYAFGIVLYELLCGERPFTAARPIDFRIRHCDVPPRDVRRLNRHLPGSLAELVSSCLAKAVTERPQTFGAVAERLAEIHAQASGIAFWRRRRKPSAREISQKYARSQAWSLIRRGTICQAQGDIIEASDCFAQASDIFRATNDLEGLWASLDNEARVLQAFGDLDAAMKLYEEAETLHKGVEVICRQSEGLEGRLATLRTQELLQRARGDVVAAGEVEAAIALLLRCRGDVSGAMVVSKQRMDLSTQKMELDEQQEAAVRRLLPYSKVLRSSLVNKALILKAHGDLKGAMDLLKQHEEVCRRSGNLDELPTGLGNQALILKARGDLEGAMRLFKQQEETSRRSGDLVTVAASLDNQALILAAWGLLDGAMELHRKEEEICRFFGNLRSLQKSLSNQACILQSRGDFEGAMKLFEQMEGICRDLGDVRGVETSLNNQIKMLEASQTQRGWSGYTPIKEIRSRKFKDKFVALCKQEEPIAPDRPSKDAFAYLLKDALTCWSRGDLTEAIKLLEEHEKHCRWLADLESLESNLAYQEAILKDCGDMYGLQRILRKQALILKHRRDLDGAMKLFKQLEAIWRREWSPDNQIKEIQIGEIPDKVVALYKYRQERPIDALALRFEQALRSRSRGDLTEAIKLLEEHEKYCRRLADLESLESNLAYQEEILKDCGDGDGLQRILGKQALILKDRRDLDGAMKLLKQQEEICWRWGNMDGLQTSLSTQALILWERVDLHGAMKLLKEAEGICRRLGNSGGLATSLTLQAIILGLCIHKPREALPLAEEAYHLTTEHGFRSLAHAVKRILYQLRSKLEAP